MGSIFEFRRENRDHDFRGFFLINLLTKKYRFNGFFTVDYQRTDLSGDQSQRRPRLELTSRSPGHTTRFLAFRIGLSVREAVSRSGKEAILLQRL